MKKGVLLFLLLGMQLFSRAGDKDLNSCLVSVEVLTKVSNKLNSLSQIDYTHTRIINYPSDNVYDQLTGRLYLDFTSADKIMGMKFFFESAYYISGFNGSEYFICDKDKKTLDFERLPNANSLKQKSFLNHSLYSLKNALPWEITDVSISKSVRDTAINNTPCFLVTLGMNNANLRASGAKGRLRSDIKMKYSVVISKGNYLPMQIVHHNNYNKNEIRTEFSDIKENDVSFDKNLFFYSNYTGYKVVDVGTIKAKPLISKARPAHDFKLPILDEGQQFISLDQFKGKVVLLDFWIIHCGPCIEVIPKVKNLVKKFDKNDLVFLSVNAYDSASQIESFQKKYPTADYNILYNGKEVADQYGVRAFPTFVLIDKKGVVLYAGGYNEEKLYNLIRMQL